MTPESAQSTAVNSLALKLLRKVTGLSEHDLRESTTFESINLESLAITAFVSSLESHFPGLSKTFIFDCRNILDVTSYLLRQHADDVGKLLSTQATHQPDAAADKPVAVHEPIQEPIKTPADVSDSLEEWPEITFSADPAASMQDDGIAIIGMHGRFPGADSLEEFWQNLYQGRHAITEIPSDRWSLEQFYEEGTDSRKSGLSYAKWGGFVAEADKFDAQFFGIAPREAAQMDPQERFFLECAWHAMENAALLGERAENLKQGNNYNIGVFVGLTTNTYNLLAPDNWRNGGVDVPAAVPWSSANRVSYALNLSGPSLAIDAACSSSLVALHLACESLAKGECKAAIAGGVNLYFHPAKYIQLCQLQMLSPTGRCHTFGRDGDGFVPGEGVGAIVLKPLAAAKADGDRILGVIRGTSVNHCGRTNGYTVPNAQSQSQLIKTALDAFNLPPSSISYIEAHGTGTKLGDPIEFTALKETLAGGDISVPCGMGSVKSNIGHLESAAGIAGIIKVLLQFKHGYIAPSLGSQELNAGLDIAGSRFFVPQTPTRWQPDAASGVRRAGVSSFGAGGTNGHVILEEAREQDRPFQADANMPLVFPLSARSEEQLQTLLSQLLQFIQSAQFSTYNHALYSLAYILQCGRKHHSFRFVTVAKSIAELAKNIAQYLENPASGQGPAAVSTLASYIRPDEETGVQNHVQEPLALARLWSQGAMVVWRDLWNSLPPLMEIPLYPFAKERHWINSGVQSLTMPPNPHKSQQADGAEQAFHFTGQEYFLQQHRISGKPIFPAAGYFSYFQNVAAHYGLQEKIELHSVTWANPFRPDGINVSSMICDVKQDHEDLTLTFTSPDQKTIYCRARCTPGAASSAPLKESLADIQARCSNPVDVQPCYSAFNALDMVYGPAFRSMHGAWVGGDRLGENAHEALVEVRGTVKGAAGLEPGMLDGIFQSSFVLSFIANPTAEQQFIPYSVKTFRLYNPLPERVIVHVTQRPSRNESWKVFDFVVFAPNGERILEVEEFGFRTVAKDMEKPAPVRNEHRVYTYRPIWVESPFVSQNRIDASARIVIFDRTPDFYQALCSAQPALVSSLWLVIPGKQFQVREGNVVELDYRKEVHLELLWRMFLADGALPEHILINLAAHAGAHDLNTSWEAYAGLDGSKDSVEIIRSACRATSAPRFHAQINYLDDAGKNGLGASIAGFLRSVNLEIPTITATVVSAVDKSAGGHAMQHFLSEFLATDPAGVREIKWQEGKRFIRALREETETQDMATPQLAADDVVVITGGAGAIAKYMAEHLAETAGIRIALIGRSAKTQALNAFLGDLRNKNLLIDYWQADCTDREKLATALADIRARFGAISGVLHCAGTLKDAFFLRQDKTDWDYILKAKVLGALWLDELTQSDPLKWFVLCSGLAGVRGNIGQSTYGLGNAWLNAFAEQRQLQRQNTRPGQKDVTLSIAWSLWDTESGMQAPKSIVDRYAKKGLLPLSKQEGIQIFQHALNYPHSVLIPIKGKADAIAEFFDIAPEPVAATPSSKASAPPTSSNQDGIEDSLIHYLAGHLSKVTKTAIEKINPEVALEAFGLDSILVMELNDALEKDFPQMSKTVLFEARSLRLLARLLIAEHKADALKLMQKSAVPAAIGAPIENPSAELIVTPVLPKSDADAWDQGKPSEAAPGKKGQGDHIAVVGIAGRYPGASNLHELWQHLSAGDDLITEIPGRWASSETNPMYANWGGFIEDFDRFDPLFFGISPRDAERMDPQERLFLQTAWHTLEDAGYTPESLSGGREQLNTRRRVGVIVGVMYGEYQLYSAEEQAQGVITNSSYASIANRVSYCMDFDGPSFAVDSMCSSSLTSISIACDQLRMHRCDAVIAGGVNLSIHPHKYRMLCELNFASTDGRCRSFGEGGDGYVPGEGVGAVLLKRLEDAERDGDHIYAVIQGSDIGHGAKTSGYTVPNADAQADVVRRAFERSGLQPSRLSYLEAHGTGTSLGDPIEIRGVTKALAADFAEDQTCPVGSIKSNIGHLESAAGIAAVSKVLLQFQHEKLVPSIHSDTLNQNIDFSRTPFFIQRELAEWKRTPLPRVAAVSSFGAGGANAHIVIEEYVASEEPATVRNEKEVFRFSARSNQQLQKMLRNFILYLDREMVLSAAGVSHHVTRYKFNISDVAMTLAHGRRDFRFRLAVTAKNFSQLHNTLNRFIAICENDDPKNRRAALEAQEIFYGDTEEQTDTQSNDHWVRGGEQDKPDLSIKWRKVPLPGYEFLRNRYWIEEESKTNESKPSVQISPQRNEVLTPQVILDRVAQGAMTQDEARIYLRALSKETSARAQEQVIS